MRHVDDSCGNLSPRPVLRERSAEGRVRVQRRGGVSYTTPPGSEPSPSPLPEYRAREFSNLHEAGPDRAHFAADVVDGLQRSHKQLPCKYFYDRRGSQLFERICQLPEYYLTRTELSILRRRACEIASILGPRCLLVEYGSGSSLKTRLLLDHLYEPAGYVPVDISRSQLLHSARALSAAYPRLRILPVCADYTTEFDLPDCDSEALRTIIYFPGSTIGNFHPHEARHFLGRIARVGGPGSGLLIGVDLKKDPRLLHAAYNDSAGITAEFNLNILQRINAELDGDFAPESFTHYAFYNAPLGRIEMHLVSLESQTARAAGESFDFAQGESIFTESSYKYTCNEFETLARQAGYHLEHIWMDERNWFGVQYLTACRQ